MGKTLYLSDSERFLLCGLLRGEAPADLMGRMRRIYGDGRDFEEMSLVIIRKLED